MDTVEEFQCVEGVQLHLRVVLGFHQNILTVLVVHDMESTVGYDHAVADAEVFFDILGEVDPLLDSTTRRRRLALTFTPPRV